MNDANKYYPVEAQNHISNQNNSNHTAPFLNKLLGGNMNNNNLLEMLFKNNNTNQNGMIETIMKSFGNNKDMSNLMPLLNNFKKTTKEDTHKKSSTHDYVKVEDYYNNIKS